MLDGYRATAVIEEKYEDAALILAKYVGGVTTEITIKKISGTEAAENEHVIRVQTEPVNISESDYETGVYLRAYIREDFLTIKPIGGTASVYSKKQSETGGGIVGEGEEVGDLWQSYKRSGAYEKKDNRVFYLCGMYCYADI